MALSHELYMCSWRLIRTLETEMNIEETGSEESEAN